MIADAPYRSGAPNEGAAYIKPPAGPGDMLRTASSTSSAGQAASAEMRQPMLDLRIVMLEKGRRDLTFRLQARTNLPHYRSNNYPNILRTYREIALLCLALTLQHPSSILQALPIPFPALISASQGSAAARTQAENAAVQHQEDIFLTQLQRWFQRLISDPPLLHSLELRNFIESEFSYHPTPPDAASASPALRKRFSAGAAALSSAGVSGLYGPVDVGSSVLGLPSGAGTSGSSSATSAAKSLASSIFSSIGGSSSAAGAMGFATSRSLHDEDDELVGAREEVTRLEMQFAQAAEALEKLSVQRKAQLEATAKLSAKMTNLAACEEIRPPSAKLGLPHALGCTGEMLRRVTDLEDGQARMDILTLGDMLAYQSLNARSAKEAMLSRNALVEEHYNVTKQVAARKQAAESLRGAATIRPEKVDEALQEYAEAREREREVAIHLQGVSQGLKTSLRRHSKFAHADLEEAVVAHGRESLRRSRIMFDVIRGLKPEIRRAPNQGPREPVQPIPAGGPVLVQPLPSPAPQAPSDVPSATPSQPAAPSARVATPQGPAASSGSAQQSPIAAASASSANPPPPASVAAGPPTPPAKADSPGPNAGSNVPVQRQPSASGLPTQSSTSPPFGNRASPFASMSQSMHQPSPSPFASMSAAPAANPFAPPPGPGGSQESGMAKSMFVERTQGQQQQPGAPIPPNPFGNGFGSGSTINGGGLNSGRSRISARDAARSLAGKF